MMRLSWRFLRTAVLVGIVISLVSLFYYNTLFDNEPNNPGSGSQSVASQFDDKTRYTIVIDAGSTGSRIHVFKLFHENDQRK
jgi:hypothetical protein